jgi:hypothetical protein
MIEEDVQVRGHDSQSPFQQVCQTLDCDIQYVVLQL